MAPKSKFKVAFVTWIDASATEEYSNEAELKEKKDYLVHSAGILVVSNKHHISLAQDYSATREDFRRTLHIPRRYIKAISVVEVVGTQDSDRKKKGGEGDASA